MNKMLGICPQLVVSKLDLMVDKFTMIYQKNSANLKKEGEADRALGLMRGVLRITEGLQRNSEAAGNMNFQQWF
jgi:hypothetical protein